MREECGVSKSLLQLRERELMYLLPGPLRCLFEQGGQWSGSVSKIVDKTLVEACQAQKTPDIFYRARGGPVRDGHNLVGVRFDPFAIHEISTKLDFALAKRAFIELREEFLSSEVEQNR